MDPAANTVGSANCFGEVQFDGHFGAVEFSRSERFDFVYHFTTQPGVTSPLFGRGFFLPLLESRLIDHDQFLEYTTLGGARRFIYRLPADPDHYVSLDGRETAHRNGSATFVRESSDGYQVRYQNGRMIGFQTPRKAGVVLHYDDDGVCRSVTSSSGGTVLSVTRPDATGTLKFSNASGAFEAKFQKYYALSETGESEETAQTLLTMKWPDGTFTRFDYSEPGVSPMALTMSYADESLEVAWDETEKIVSSSGADYRVSSLSRGFDPTAERIAAGTWSVDRQWPDGDWHHYGHDEDNGIIEENGRDEDLTLTYLIANLGPTCGYVRKRVRFPTSADPYSPDPTGPGETIYESFYDGGGRLIRELIDGKVYWHFRPGGLDQSVAASDDNFFRYDEKDRLILRRVDGAYTRITWARDGSRRIVCRYPWGEVTLRHYDANGQPAPIPANDNFPEKSSAQVEAATAFKAGAGTDSND